MVFLQDQPEIQHILLFFLCFLIVLLLFLNQQGSMSESQCTGICNVILKLLGMQDKSSVLLNHDRAKCIVLNPFILTSPSACPWVVPSFSSGPDRVICFCQRRD